jgi:hypothetical protein
MPLPPECMKKGHPDYGGGRPRTRVPEKDELIELGKDLVNWASEKQKKGEPIRVRFCDWYTEKGFVRKQWESFRILPEFVWYYERARSLLALRYVDGTVNPSIAHRFLRMYDPEVRDEEDQDAKAAELRKAAALKGETRAAEEEKLKVIEEVSRNKRKLK